MLETQAGSEVGSRLAVELYAVAAAAVAAGHFAAAVGLGHGPVLELGLAVVGSAVVVAAAAAAAAAVDESA